MPVQKICLLFILLIFAMLSVSQSILAQSTAFSYQGRLLDSGNPANGQYDLQFKLFDTATVGTGAQQGSTVTVSNVTVSNGSFSVSLDFGACPTCFDGSSRFLEVAVKPTSGSTFTTLSPRQPMLSTPYAIKSANATTAEGLSAAASATFIQNGTSQQTSTNFNISGNGTAGGTLTGSIVNAVTQVNINGLRVFTVTGPYNDGTTIFTASNTFAGESAGLNTTPDPNLSNSNGKFNSFYGAAAGQANTTGRHNAFFGYRAGQLNTTGIQNAFFGSQAGNQNIASFNAFFGAGAGISNTTGSENAFFGGSAGFFNTTGFQNAFFGGGVGSSNTTGSENAFFGDNAGDSNTTGSNNTFIGSDADFNSANPMGNNNTLLGFATRVNSGVSNGTAMGANASVTQSNSLVLGGITGINNGTSVNVGIGTTAPAERLHVVGNGLITGNLTVNGTVNLPSLAGQFIQNSTTQQANSNYNISGNGIVGGTLSVGNASTSARLFLYRASAIAANSADINFISGGTPDFSLGTSQGSAAPSDFSIYNYGTSSNVITISRSTGFVGIGTTAPQFKLHVDGGVWGISTSGAGVIGTGNNGFGVKGYSTNGIGVYGYSFGGYAGYFEGKVVISTLGGAGSGQLCRNLNLEIATCSSSLRYKTAIQPFTGGLDLIKRLRPISFTWKQGGMRDLGFGAEEVEKVEPLLVTYNAKGEVEGVKYDRLTLALVNAAREQQARIEEQQTQINQQQAEIATLRQELRQVKQQKELIRRQQQEIVTIKQLLCASHPRANLCKAKLSK